MSVNIQGAVMKEQGQTFAIVLVKRHVIQNSKEAQKSQNVYKRYFPKMPIILMAQDSQGTPTYFGRPDIVNFLANVHPGGIPLKRYNFDEPGQ